MADGTVQRGRDAEASEPAAPAPADDPPSDPGPDHAVAAPEHWPWLPKLDDGTLDKHPFCLECGAVQVVGRQRGVKLGALLNRLAYLDKRLRRTGRKLTEAQRRLVVKRLEAAGADDAFAMSRAAQDELLKESVVQVTGLDAGEVDRLLGDG